MGDWQEVVNMSGEIPESWFAPDKKTPSNRTRGSMQSGIRRQAAILRFDTFAEALDWARKNPGRTITNSPDGNGFIAI